MNNIYLDYAATTPVDERITVAMQPYFSQVFGNPSSLHRYGQQAEAALEKSRRKLAGFLGAKPSEIIFTSCGSESDNMAIRRAAVTARQKSSANHLLISPIEHPAVHKTAVRLADLHGFDLSFLPIDEYGMVSPAGVQENLREDIDSFLKILPGCIRQVRELKS